MPVIVGLCLAPVGALVATCMYLVFTIAEYVGSVELTTLLSVAIGVQMLLRLHLDNDCELRSDYQFRQSGADRAKTYQSLVAAFPVCAARHG